MDRGGGSGVENALGLLQSESERIMVRLDSDKESAEDINRETLEFFNSAISLGMGGVNDHAEEYSSIIERFDSKLRESSYWGFITGDVKRKALLTAALALKTEPSRVQTPQDSTRETSGIPVSSANRWQLISDMTGERIRAEDNIQDVVKDVGKLLHLAKIDVRRPEDLIDMDLLKASPEKWQADLTAHEQRAKLEGYVNSFLHGGVTSSEGEWLVKYFRADVANKLNDTVFSLLSEFASTTNQLFLYRGVSFDTEEKRAEFVRRINEEGIQVNPAARTPYISTTPVLQVAMNFIRGPYGVLIRMDFSKVRVTEVKYYGPDAAEWSYRSECELRVSGGSIPAEAISEITLINQPWTASPGS
jgi:hypothetical protein